ncbi:MAG: N-6 DNA methylase, partial [Candidatus Scalindua sp.]|nr:N-6 DNA methylase [Candidatus Scalindua sp.]
DSANKLRGTVESSEYKHVVLGLIFLKYAGDKFQQRKQELIDDNKQDFVENDAFYTMKNVFFLPEESRWSYVIKNSKQDDIAIKIDTALHTIEKNNKSLKGALPDNYFSRLNMDVSKLSALLDTINNIDTLKDEQQDIVGRVYEYFLKKFAIKEGKGKGEFYTPKTIVNLIAEMIEPYKGVIYDPACGSGGMFVQSMKFIKSHHGNKKDVAIYGQELTSTTYKLGKMNLAIRGINANLGAVANDTFHKDQHPDLKADYVMANPPFNLKDWREEDELLDDHRWNGYVVPPKSNANYAWILNMVSKLSENGIAGFILSNGALFGGAEEYKIRRKLIENDLVEAIIVLPRDMFYTTDISVTLWILNKNKKQRNIEINKKDKQYRDRKGEVLFMDLRTWGSKYEKKYIELTKDDVDKVALNYHNWQQVDFASTYKDVAEYCYCADFDEIKENDFSLVPSRYIEFVDRDSGIDFDSEMKRIQKDFSVLLQEEKDSQQQLIDAFKALGYDL